MEENKVELEQSEIEKQIITVLEKVRPFLIRDGGDIEFVSYKDGEVFVRMVGACAGCEMIDSTLQDGVATLLQEEVPGVTKVTNVVFAEMVEAYEKQYIDNNNDNNENGEQK